MILMTLIILVILIDLTLQMVGEAAEAAQEMVGEAAEAAQEMAVLMDMDVQSEVIILVMTIHFLT